jgi:TPR repeat protein
LIGLGIAQARMEVRMFRLASWLALAALACGAMPTRADYDAGWDAYQRRDYRRALAELVPAADSDPRAALALSGMFQRGEGVAPDAHQALMWLRRAGEIGDATLQFQVGEAYANGAGAPMDTREAAQWYRRAAERGHAAAQFALGKQYLEGAGVAPDPDEGRRWIERAAAAGYAPARVWLGLPAEPSPAAAAPAPAPQPAHAPPPQAPPPASPDRSAHEEPTSPHHAHTTWYYGFSYGYGWGPPYYGWYPYWGPPWPYTYWGWGWGYPWYGPAGAVHFGVVVHP